MYRAHRNVWRTLQSNDCTTAPVIKTTLLKTVAETSDSSFHAAFRCLCAAIIWVQLNESFEVFSFVWLLEADVRINCVSRRPVITNKTPSSPLHPSPPFSASPITSGLKTQFNVFYWLYNFVFRLIELWVCIGIRNSDLNFAVVRLCFAKAIPGIVRRYLSE